jgi:hypothetical protein
VSHHAGTCGQQTPLRRASAGRTGDKIHMGLGMGVGAGWAAGARVRGATFRHVGTGWARCVVQRPNAGTRAPDGMRTRGVGCGAR